MREGISACIITLNEEDKIRRCLESVAWCEEVVVVDSFSEDGTLGICREFTDQIHQNRWPGFIAQRNFIRGKASQPWVLFLDADEEVSPGLRAEIERELDRGDRSVAGYQFPRMVYYLGAWIRHGEWYPDMKLRLFRRELGRSEGEEPHEHVKVEGVVRTLKHPLWHYTYDDLTDHLRTLNRFSGISARAKFDAGRRFHWWDIVFRPPIRFFKGYLLKRGFLDGRRGLLIAVLSAFGVAMKYAKLWEAGVGGVGSSGEE